jgi:hypothetical protein
LEGLACLVDALVDAHGSSRQVIDAEIIPRFQAGVNLDVAGCPLRRSSSCAPPPAICAPIKKVW